MSISINYERLAAQSTSRRARTLVRSAPASLTSTSSAARLRPPATACPGANTEAGRDTEDIKHGGSLTTVPPMPSISVSSVSPPSQQLGTQSVSMAAAAAVTTAALEVAALAARAAVDTAAAAVLAAVPAAAAALCWSCCRLPCCRGCSSRCWRSHSSSAARRCRGCS